MSSKFKVKIEDKGKRLDKFLVEKLPEKSRSQIQKMIKEGLILVNGKIPTVHQFLKENDQIEVKEIKIKSLKPKTHKLELDIISEDENYLIVCKPANLLVHPTEKKEKETLVNLVLKKYPKIKNIGENPQRPGIVHRLDKDVSGLMVIAKTSTAFEDLKKQFAERKIKKEYIALVFGKLSQPQGIIDFPIGRSIKGFKMAARAKTAPQESKEAITEYELISEHKNYSLLKIKTKTGRTHQIRVHLNAIGHPVVGDPIYKPKRLKLRKKLDRIFLHSSLLGFYDLEGNYKEFKSNSPSDLQDYLKNL